MKYPQLVSMPSEISDWLEEQLEARGIDSVVYTRYILSLLHRDPIDLVCPDQDLNFAQPNKEVRRSGSGRKRFRCFSEWRDHAQADAEQLKRSAAIECLMSASDQNCGIESLVDELCEKLKEINKDALANSKPASSNSSALQTISPQDLARQYYAAFPPLIQHRTPPSIVTLLPKWFSPKKKGRKSRSASFDDKLHKIDDMKARAGSKQRYFSRSRNDLGYSRSMAKSVERSESMTDWDLFMFTNNTKNKQGGAVGNSEKFDQIAEEKANMDNIEPEQKENKVEWSDEESMNICDDLPVDILDLLDSPSPQNYTVAMMNLANMRDAGNKNFIHCGTNITSSIWSIDAFDDSTMFDNNYNAALDTDQSETLLGIKFKSLTVGNKSIESIWSNQDIVENETNMIYENFGKSSLTNPGNVFGNNLSTWSTSGMENLDKWSEGVDFDNEQYLRLVALSLLKLNHNKEESSFIETVPRVVSNNTETKTATTPADKVNSFFTEACDKAELSDTEIKKASVEKEEENLLTSMRSHFRPINAFSTSNDNKSSKKYQDGSSFVISGILDRPNYKRSDSGSQYLETVFGSPKKLLEYKGKNSKSSQNAFVLKFFVCQNDKACQTENSANDSDGEMDNSQEVPCKKRVMSQPEEFFFPGDEELLEDESKQCKCFPNNEMALNPDFSYGDDTVCYMHTTRPDSVLAEMWKNEPKRCDKCSNSSSWSSNWGKMGSNESIWQLNKESLQSIWNGGEVCSACLGLNGGRPPLSAQQSQLREDISQDGEQLLSDLSTLQKSYMEQLPAAEISYDISELIVGTKERKRRHSPVLEMTKNAVPVHRGSWSIASQVKQDRFMQVASVPVLHSVTL